MRRLGSRAMASVEFAMCAPMLLLLFIGTLEIALLYRTEAKLNALTGDFAEMLSNQEVASVSDSGATMTHSPVPSVTSGASPPGLSDLCAGAVLGLQPFPASGLTLYVASVTETAAAVAGSQGVAAKPASYDEWEVDLDGNCMPTGAQNIGAASAKATAVGNGGSTALLLAAGDNAIIVRASLRYPGLVGLILGAAPTLSQTAIARWRYASASNVTNVTVTPAPSATLEFSCSGTGCVSNLGI